MRVLLLGEFSGLHQNLAVGLREFGVDVTVASDGDGWKDYPRDIDLFRDFEKSRNIFLFKLLKRIPNLSGYDVVQLNNPKFLNATPTFNSLVFNYLNLTNKNIFLGAHGMDTYYINYALSGKLKHSVFQVPQIQNDPHIIQLKKLAKNCTELNLNKKIAQKSKGIVASSPGYYLSYKKSFPNKTTYIPVPIDTKYHSKVFTLNNHSKKIKFFLGKMKGRIYRKGTDVIHDVLLELKKKYPNDIELIIVNSVPFNEYQTLLNSSHVLCDQLYAYGIGLNGLIAQSKGLIVCGGADEEMYNALGEEKNRPIIDLNVPRKKMLESFEQIIANKSILHELSSKNRDFVVKHHDSAVIAEKYIKFWKENC